MEGTFAGLDSVPPHAGWRRLGVGVALGLSVLGKVAVGHAGVPPPDRFLYIKLANMEPARTWYSVVPSDARVVVPLAALSKGYSQYPSSVPLSITEGGVEPDADSAGPFSYYGVAPTSPELTFVPGRTYTARMRYLPYSPDGAQYLESTFSFTIHAGTAGELLEGVELRLSEPSAVAEEVNPTCCEVEPAECGEASSCYQCWQRVSYSPVQASWYGPAVPYMGLHTRATTDNLTPHAAGVLQDAYLLETPGEYCVEGTATLGGESRTVSRCVTVSELPALPEEDWADAWVLAEAQSCLGEPAPSVGVTYLYVKRGATEEEPRQAVMESSQPPYHEPLGTCAFGGREPRHDPTSWRLLAGLLGLGYCRWRRRDRV